MAGNPWDYSLLHGPNTWPKTFPEAAGKRQSPINIEPDKVQHDPSLEKTPLCANYELEDDYKLANTGMSVQISKTSVVRGVQLHGGPLSHNYRFDDLVARYALETNNNNNNNNNSRQKRTKQINMRPDLFHFRWQADDGKLSLWQIRGNTIQIWSMRSGRVVYPLHSPMP